jgi:hypothetical protein
MTKAAGSSEQLFDVEWWVVGRRRGGRLLRGGRHGTSQRRNKKSRRGAVQFQSHQAQIRFSEFQSVRSERAESGLAPAPRQIVAVAYFRLYTISAPSSRGMLL